MEYELIDLTKLSLLRDQWYLLKDPGLEGYRLDPLPQEYQTVNFFTDDKIIRKGFVIPTIDFSKYNLDNLKKELFIVEMQFPQSSYNSFKENVFFELNDVFAYQYPDQSNQVFPIIREY